MKAARSLWTLGQGFRPHGLFARSFLFPVVQRQPYLQGSWSTVLVNGPAPRCLSTKRIPNYEVKGPERTHKTDKDRAKSEKRRLKREAKAPELIDLRIAIIGRPNVGKSTLFNRLAGRQLALVDSHPGVTRDVNESIGTVGMLQFHMADTAGLEDVRQNLDSGMSRKEKKESAHFVNKEPLNVALQQAIIDQTERAVAECDVVLFVMDAREGLTPMDQFFASWLRKRRGIGPANSTRKVPIPVILIANKAESIDSLSTYSGILEAYKLGFGEPIPMSAEYGDGLGLLYEALDDALKVINLHYPERSLDLRRQREYLKAQQQLQAQVRASMDIDLKRRGQEVAQEQQGDLLLNKEDAQALQEIEWSDAEEGEDSQDLNEEEKEERSEEEGEEKDGEERVGPGVSLSALTKPIRAVDTKKKNASVGGEEKKDGDEKQRENERGEREQEKGEDTSLMIQKLQLAIVGRPNVGKSTLINSLIGEEKMITGSQAGITRDAISVEWERQPGDSPGSPDDPEIYLVDTAGLRGLSPLGHSRFARVDALAMHRSIQAIKMSHIVVLVIDASEHLRDDLSLSFHRHDQEEIANIVANKILTSTDLEIASLAVAEGRALVIVANKWDAIEADMRPLVLKGLDQTLNRVVGEARGVPIIPCSALKGFNIQKLRPLVLAQYKLWNARVSTGVLNRWLAEVRQSGQTPKHLGKEIKLKYITQVKSRPPTFAIFSSRAKQLQESYVNFLKNSIRKEWELFGIPIRLILRTPANPFAPSTDGSGRGGRENRKRFVFQASADAHFKPSRVNKGPGSPVTKAEERFNERKEEKRDRKALILSRVAAKKKNEEAKRGGAPSASGKPREARTREEAKKGKVNVNPWHAKQAQSSSGGGGGKEGGGGVGGRRKEGGGGGRKEGGGGGRSSSEKKTPPRQKRG